MGTRQIHEEAEAEGWEAHCQLNHQTPGSRLRGTDRAFPPTLPPTGATCSIWGSRWFLSSRLPTTLLPVVLSWGLPGSHRRGLGGP